MTDSRMRRLDVLQANARYATERYRLYRARVSGPNPTSTRRLHELQRESEQAERTLKTMTKENDAIDRH